MRAVYRAQESMVAKVVGVGCICGNEKGMLAQVKGKMDRFQYLEILENLMIPSAWSIRSLDYIFMHDNGSCQKAHLIIE